MKFRALTFNMQNGQVWDPANPDSEVVDLDQTIGFLREQDADLIFLQEVEKGHNGGNQIEPPPNYSLLRKAFPAYDSVFAYPIPNPLEIPFGLGLAIFSKTPLEEFQRVDLPPADISFRFGGKKRIPSHRLLISASTKIDGRPVRLLNTHLQAFFMIGCTSDTHPSQRNIVEQQVRNVKTPTVLAGDFNCAPGEGVVEQIGKVGFQAAQNTEVTWRRKPFVLDHIFYNAPLILKSCSVIPTLASDHHGVCAELDFSE